MKTLMVVLAGLGGLAAAGVAEAASPAYCALYAREYANQFSDAAGQQPGSEQRIQDEAYYRCLNQDEDPQLPSSSAYYGVDVEAAAGGQGGPLEPLADSAAPAGDKQAAPSGYGAALPAATASPAARSYTGGEKPWTAEWLVACRKYFPNSFNEKDGTILPHGSTRRVFCK